MRSDSGQLRPERTADPGAGLRWWCSARGYSLVELLFVAGFLSMLTAVGYRVLTHMQQASPNLAERLGLQMDARRAADTLVGIIREGTEIVRPAMGESRPYLVFKDTKNFLTLLYLDRDDKHSEMFKKDLYKMVQYRDEFRGRYQPENEKVLFEAVERVTFTSVSPTNVSVNLTLANLKGSFEFLTFLGVMNLGDVE